MNKTIKEWCLIIIPVVALLALSYGIYWLLILRRTGRFEGLYLSDISGLDFLYCLAAIFAALGILLVFIKLVPMKQLYVESVRILSDSYSLGFFAIYYIPNALAEEVIFRGALQPVIGLIPAAILFTLIHVAYIKKPFVVLETFLMALILGGLYLLTGSIWLTTIAHAAFNFIETWMIKTDRIQYYSDTIVETDE